jgi:hypothetical protein
LLTTVLERGEQQLKEQYSREELRIEIIFMSKKVLGDSGIIHQDLIKNSAKKSSSKRNTLSESSSCDFKKKKQDDTQETDSNGV